VLPEYQGRGIGTWCMRRVERLARGAGCVAVRLDAYERYAELLRFYEKLGYRRKGTIYWKDLGTVCFEKQLLA
jgi:GNAT superfamily N-acetyltransferase